MSTDRRWRAAQLASALAAAAGLAVDAYVHLDLADTYDAVRSATVSQGDLFRVEAVAAIVAALAIVVRPRRYTAIAAFLVAGGGLAAVLTYRYVDVGTVGPLPAMYEPVWYPEKTQSAWAEGVAAVAAVVTFAVVSLRARRRRVREPHRADAPDFRSADV